MFSWETTTANGVTEREVSFKTSGVDKSERRNYETLKGRRKVGVKSKGGFLAGGVGPGDRRLVVPIDSSH